MRTNNVSVESFVKLLKDCRGKIHLVSTEGEHLIVDSYLSAVVGFQKMMNLLPNNKLSIHCEFDDDQNKLDSFFQTAAKSS
ncbi:MAG: hypothetical protein GX028_04990 [Clostridiaceae bacterium]|nr:hypothetical protein [Clostridiaceae bacterium]